MALIRQPGPDSGLGFDVEVLKPFEVVPFFLGNGSGDTHYRECGFMQGHRCGVGQRGVTQRRAPGLHSLIQSLNHSTNEPMKQRINGSRTGQYVQDFFSHFFMN